MLLRLYVRVDSVSSVNDVGFQHSVLPVTRDAFVAGALPEPVSDDQQWYLHDGDQIAIDPDAGAPGRHYDYDIRSGRRLPHDDDVLVHVFENSDDTSGIVYSVFARLLVSRP